MKKSEMRKNPYLRILGYIFTRCAKKKICKTVMQNFCGTVFNKFYIAIETSDGDYQRFSRKVSK